ncbi:hypothetical protein BpHYR1_029264 [Brachionus plicatilis]|uniref:Uncharacterized protein n=1 Tax=Brachionus plicatilis TaxID=10195 RepID=A0A3M7Q8U2_BRAPC|nr:hypothetical protein BpHYR1_029264 [Brachionus plicatilis]
MSLAINNLQKILLLR